MKQWNSIAFCIGLFGNEDDMKNKIRLFAGAVCLLLEMLLFFEKGSVCAAQDSGSVSFYHMHTGDSEKGGGCYGREVSNTRECGSYQLSIWDNGQGSYNYLCTKCGNQWVYQYKLVGEHCRNKITERHYERNCGMDNTVLATLSCSKSESGWTKELDLTASCQINHGGFTLLSEPYVWNGSASSSAAYHVTQNGTYTLGIRAQGNADLSQGISITVDNIDNCPPVISEFAAGGQGFCQQAELRVNASDSESGLAAQAYSYDGGATWTEQNSLHVEQNGTYSVIVRDAVGNQSSAKADIICIDSTKPSMEIVTSPAMEQWYDGELTILVNASDSESGLAESPYSFDGGNSFLVGNSYKITADCDLQIVVTDRAGNRSSTVLSARKKVRAPKPTTKPAERNTEQTENVSRTDGGQAHNNENTQNSKNTTENPGKETGAVKTPTPIPDRENAGRNKNRKTSPDTKGYKGNEEKNGDRENNGEEEKGGVLSQHYPDTFWQGTPIKSETESASENIIEDTVLLNELLAGEEEREIHTIKQSANKGILKNACIFGGVMMVLLTAGILTGRKVVLVTADGRNEKRDFVGIAILGKRKEDGSENIRITDSMLRKAKTNHFYFYFPLMGRKLQNKTLLITCHGVSREVPGQRLIHIRLRSE